MVPLKAPQGDTVWPLLYLPKGEYRYEKLDYWITDLTQLFQELVGEAFSGYLEILSPKQHGLFIFQQGRVYNIFHEGTEELELLPEQIFQHFLHRGKREAETIITVGALDPRIIEALGALANRPPVYRELETSFLDMHKFFSTLDTKRFTGVLRFYHIRSHTRLGNILLKMNKITREQLQAALRLQLSQKSGLRLGDALVRIEAITPQDLTSALDLQSHARKGSDIEIAIAIFFQGRCLGGYSHLHKQFKTDPEEILPQLAGTEVLMDILEGGLPEPVDLDLWLLPGIPDTEEAPGEETIAAAARQAAPMPAAPAPSQSASARTPMKPADESETFSLRADDLVLDISFDTSSPATPPTVKFSGPTQPETHAWPEQISAAAVGPQTEAGDEGTEGITILQPEPTPEEAAAEAPVAPDSENVLPVAESPVSPPVDTLAQALREARGLEFLQAVAEKGMGFVGRALLRLELHNLGLPPRDLTPAQLHTLSEGFLQSAVPLIGTTAAQRLEELISARWEA